MFAHRETLNAQTGYAFEGFRFGHLTLEKNMPKFANVKGIKSVLAGLMLGAGLLASATAQAEYKFTYLTQTGIMPHTFTYFRGP